MDINITKSGYDAITETDPNNFIFKGSLNTFKILSKTVLTSQTVNSDPKIFTIAHGLGYTPNFTAFAEFPDGKVSLPGEFEYGGDFTASGVANRWTTYADDTYIYLSFERGGSNYSVDVSVYIFEAAV